MKKKNTTAALSWVLFALTLCFLVSLAMPYFAYGENGETISLLSYLSFPNDHADTAAWIEGQVAGYQINDLANVHVALFLGVIVAGVLLVVLRDKPVSSVITCGVGIWGLVTYGGNAILRLGGAARTVQLVLLGAMAVLGLVTFAMQMMPQVQARKEMGRVTAPGKQITG